MSVQSLINRRAQTQRALSNTRQLKATAQTKIDRLKQAKAEISQLIVETTQMERKLTSFSISPADWQGSTERDFRTGPKKVWKRQYRIMSHIYKIPVVVSTKRFNDT